MRSLCLIAAVVCSYLLLRGHPVDWPPVPRICLSGFTLVIGIIVWGRGASFTSKDAASERAAGWLDYFSLGAGILALEAIFLFFFATAPEKLSEMAVSLDERLHPGSYRTTGKGESEQESSGTSETSGNWLWQNNGQRSLGTRGRVRPSNRPEVFLWPRQGEKYSTFGNELYLRSFTLARYDSGTWKARPIPTVGRQAQDEVIQLRPKKKSDFHYEISHEPNTSGQSLLVGVPDITSVSLPSLRLIAPDTYRLPLLEEGAKLHRYRASSRPLFFNPTNDRPAAAERGELDIPESLRDQLNLLTENLVGTKPEKLDHIRSLLAERCQYSLETSFGPDEEIISQFLTTERRGYCEHFATAAALLARTIGYPSRVAYGWSGGRYFEGPNMYVFRAKEAHAWTEVKIAGKGWVIFEATPADRSEGSSSLADNSEPPPLPGGPDQSSFQNSELSLGDSDDLTLGLEPVALLQLLSGASAVAGAVALISLLILKRKKRTGATEGPGSHLLPPATNYLTAFRKACAALGNPMPIGRTLRDHLATTDSASFADELLDYHYGLHYAGKTRDKFLERRLLKEIKRWGAQSGSG
ncbi:MAG: DUF3488 and transglutaminase-like domain-containing protein [Akkermansiaceae bacterium]